MRRDYRLAMYALAASAVVIAASGAVVLADAKLPADTQSTNDTDEANVTYLNTSDDGTDTVGNISLVATDGADTEYNFTVERGERTCSGGLRLDGPDRNSTDHQVGDVTVTLASHHDGDAVEEIGRQRFAELVVDRVGDRAGLGATDHLEVQVNQYYESTARTSPLDVAGIRVRPAGSCLPSVRGTVHLDNRTVDVRSAHADLTELDLNYTGDAGGLDQRERGLVERLVRTDRHASYNVRQEFGATTRLQASVVEATHDGHVEVALREPGVSGQSLRVSLDLESETVLRSWRQVQLDSSDRTPVNASESNVTVTSNTSDGSVVLGQA